MVLLLPLPPIVDTRWIQGLYWHMPRLAWFALAPCFLLSGCFSMMSRGVVEKKPVNPGAVVLDAVTLPIQVVAVAGEGAAYVGGKALRGPSPDQVRASFKADLAKDPMILKDPKWLQERNYYLFGQFVESEDNKFTREQFAVMATPGFIGKGRSMAPNLLVRKDLPPDLRLSCLDQFFAECRAHKESGGTSAKCGFYKDHVDRYLRHPDVVARYRDECPHGKGTYLRRLLRWDELLGEQAKIARRLAADPDEMLRPGWLDAPRHRIFAREYALNMRALGMELRDSATRFGKPFEERFSDLLLDGRHLRVLAQEATSTVQDDPDDVVARKSDNVFSQDEARGRDWLRTLILRRKDCPADLKALLQTKN